MEKIFLLLYVPDIWANVLNYDSVVCIYIFVQWFHGIFDSHDTDKLGLIFYILLGGNFTFFNIIYNIRIFYISLRSLLWGNVYWYIHIHYVLYVMFFIYIYIKSPACFRDGKLFYIQFSACCQRSSTDFSLGFLIFLTLFSTESTYVISLCMKANPKPVKFIFKY